MPYIAGTLIHFIALHVSGEGAVGLGNEFLLVVEHFGNKRARLLVFFGFAVNVGVFIGSAESVGEIDGFVLEGACNRDFDERGFAHRVYLDTTAEIYGINANKIIRI